ncbi:MAG TPA: zf-HC2 domain-containing protein [Phycisphaerae bacterium]|jgi:anti-sigma factor (TIGR02949 family)
MTCGEVREILFAFLDSELDASLSIEVQRHLERCPECAREAEIERTVRRQLALNLAGQSTEAPFDPQALTQSLVGRRPRRARSALASLIRRSPSRLLAASLILGCLIGGGAWLIYRAATPRIHSASLADVLIEDFDHFLHEGRPVQIASADRQVVSDWLRQATGLGVSLPVMHSGHCKLIGARRCALGGRPAAFALYEMDGTPASLIVLADGSGDLAHMRRSEREGRVHWVDRCKGHTVVACRRNDLVYAAVSTLSEDELLHLMPTVQE